MWDGGQKFLPSQKFLRFGENCHFRNGPNMHPWQRKSRFPAIQRSGAGETLDMGSKHSKDNFWRKNNFDIFFLYRDISISISPNFGNFTHIFYVHSPLTFTYIFKIRPILGSQLCILLYLWHYAIPYSPNTAKMTTKSRFIALYEKRTFLLPFWDNNHPYGTYRKWTLKITDCCLKMATKILFFRIGQWSGSLWSFWPY